MPNQFEIVQLGLTRFTPPKIDSDLGVPAVFTKVARLTVLNSSNAVLLTTFALDSTGVVTAQRDLEDRSIADGQSFNFRLATGERGVLARVYAYWHTVYIPPLVAALGAWPRPFPFEYAGYNNNQDGQFHACLGFAGTILRQGQRITTTMASINVPADTNSFSHTVWKDNEVVHLVLWLEQNQSGTAMLGGNSYLL